MGNDSMYEKHFRERLLVGGGSGVGMGDNERGQRGVNQKSIFKY